MPAEKTNSKASESRRSNKPLMEKRRRARINQSLTELKALILDAVKKDTSRHNKLEKADILEMTVKYLQNLQRQQLAARLTTDPTVTNKFRAGYDECASEVTRFLDRAEGLEPSVRDSLSSHLNTCLSGIERKTDPTVAEESSPPAPSATITTSTSLTESSSTPASPSSMETSPRSTPSPMHLHLATAISVPMTSSPAASRDHNNTGIMLSSTDLADAFKAPLFSGFQLIPTRLASGEIAFILPTQHAIAAAHVLASQITTATATATTANLPVAAARLVPDELSIRENPVLNNSSSSEDSQSNSCSHDDSRDAESPPSADNIPKHNMPGHHSNGMLFIKEEGVWRPW